MRAIRSLVPCVLLALCLAACGSINPDTVPSQDARIETGSSVGTPVGFVVFCWKHQEACAATPNAPAVIEATSDRLGQLEKVQQLVNAAIKPEADPLHMWDYPVNGIGDCKRYALEKRRELIALGWPEQSLLLAAATTETNESHMVLVARTSQGDLVLDNRARHVVAWTQLPYHWVALESATNATQWYSVRG